MKEAREPPRRLYSNGRRERRPLPQGVWVSPSICKRNCPQDEVILTKSIAGRPSRKGRNDIEREAAQDF